VLAVALKISLLALLLPSALVQELSSSTVCVRLSTALPVYTLNAVSKSEVQVSIATSTVKGAVQRYHTELRATSVVSGSPVSVVASTFVPLTETLSGATEELSVDHVIPLSLGGSDRFENLQVLCRDCNSLKGDTVADYRARCEA
jgi:hypothetical protein